MNNVVTRFAPSPTGYLHVGGARTALFNWLHAKSTGGKFILRIEDTDLARSTKESVKTIFDALEWMKINWDEGPYFQTDRYDIYKKYLEKLLNLGKAYYCNCSKDDVEKMRKRALSIGLKPKYDGTCREKKIEKSKKSVIRFKGPNLGETRVSDLIKGKIIFQNSELDDFIICRSDGIPTYNFVVVIDDITMGVNTVLRGDDHLMNTPRQMMLYNALNQKIPLFGHIPMVLGSDRARLSKRHGAMSVLNYKSMGYLPEAFVNYIARLGWSYGNEEFFTIRDLVTKFNIKNIGKSAGIFDFKKLKALNAKHLKKCSDQNLEDYLTPFMKDRNYNISDKKYLILVMNSLRSRSKTLLDLADMASFYYKDVLYSDDHKKKYYQFLNIDMYNPISLLLARLETLEVFDKESLELVFNYIIKTTGISFSKLAQSIRKILTGGKNSPGILEIMEILGKGVVLKRLELAINFILKESKK